MVRQKRSLLTAVVHLIILHERFIVFHILSHVGIAHAVLSRPGVNSLMSFHERLAEISGTVPRIDPELIVKVEVFFRFQGSILGLEMRTVGYSP